MLWRHCCRWRGAGVRRTLFGTASSGGTSSASNVLSENSSRAYRKLPRLEDLPDAHLLPTIALVGRPNVGKSALFNRLVHRREALVYDTPQGHVTRDYREGLGQLGDLRFRVIDTSGLEPSAAAHTLQGRAAALTRGVLHDSHGVVMLLDARQGFVPGDEELLTWLRRNNPRPLVIVANKADTRAGSNNLEQMTADLAALGHEPPVPISATSGDGLADLYQLLQPLVDGAGQQLLLLQQQQQGSGDRSLPMQQQQQQQQWVQQSQHQEQEQLWRSSAAAAAAVTDGVQDVSFDTDSAAAAAAAEEDEEAEVEALVQQHMRSITAAGSDSDVSGSDSDELDGSSSSYLNPAAAAAAAAAEQAAAGVHQQHSSTSQPDSQLSDDAEATAGAGGERQQKQQQQQGPLRLAILGLPNVGKSTLMNSLLGYERSLTGPEPGLTRDPTYGWIKHGPLDIQLVDTAGWKKASALLPTQAPTAAGTATGGTSTSSSSSRGGIQQAATAVAASQADSAAAAAGGGDSRLVGKQLADASLVQARRALGACHVVVLMLDAPRLLTIEQAITRLELQLADMAITQGKALVIAINKSDAVPGGPAVAQDLQTQVAQLLEDRFLPAGRLPVLLMSAQEGEGTRELLDAVVGAYTKWNTRVSSFKLRSTLAKHSVRFFGTGGTASLLQRIKWATQLKPRPPTFVMLLRGSKPVDEGGQRFLSNVLRQSLKLQGVPLRLYLRYNKRYRDADHTDGRARVQRRKKQKLLAQQERRRQRKYKQRRG